MKVAFVPCNSRLVLDLSEVVTYLNLPWRNAEAAKSICRYSVISLSVEAEAP